MVEVIEQVKPPLVIPHALFRPERAAALARTGDGYPVHFSPSPQVTLARDTLPKSTEILVLPGD
jgi:hypothetical protein